MPPLRNLSQKPARFSGPTAPRKRYLPTEEQQVVDKESDLFVKSSGCHPLTSSSVNHQLKSYEVEVKGTFDRIVPFLKRLSEIQHHQNFVLMHPDQCLAHL